MNTCRSCHAPVIWAKTTTGKDIPLNPVPVVGGNLDLVDGVARYVQPSSGVKLYTSHFTDCPQANSHRRGKRS